MGRGSRRHVVMFQTPADPQPDGGGGWIEGWEDQTPSWPVSIQPATVRDLEYVAAGTVITTATHLITCDFRPDVTTRSRMVFKGRIFSITGIRNLEERDVTMHLIAVEELDD